MANLTKQILVDRLIDQMKQHINEQDTPTNNRTSYRVVAETYIENCIREIHNYVIFHSTKASSNKKLYYVSLTNMHERYLMPGTNELWHRWITRNSLSIIRVITKGDNIKREKSGVILQGITIMDLIDIATEDSGDYFDKCYGNFMHQNLPIEWIPIDIKSLKNYIKSTQSALKQYSAHSTMGKTLTRYIASAQSILALTLETKKRYHHKQPPYSNYYLIQFCKPQEAFQPRKYYKGISLHNVPRIVREAALGECYEYDINAGVYAFYAYLADVMNLDMPVFAMYLQNKQEVR